MAKFTPTPTLDTLTVEGLKMASYNDAAADDTNQLRAEGWIQEMFADIRYVLNGRKLKPMMITSYAVTIKGVSRYSLPGDYESSLSVALLDGNVRGTAPAGTFDGNHMEINETLETTDYGKLLLITGGTGAGSLSQIMGHSGTTIEVEPDWTTNPALNSTYLIVDRQTPLDEGIINIRDGVRSPYVQGAPTNIFPIGQGNADADETGEFEVAPVPDLSTYGLQLRYFANLNLLDLSSDANLLSTIYRKWQNIFVQKVMYKMLKTDRDDRAKVEEDIYWKILAAMVSKEAYGHDINNLQAVASDYDDME